MSQRRNKVNFNYRASLHIAMGILYLAIGSAVMYLKYFGAFELPIGLAYLLGGLMLVYGTFRIWRGWRDLKMSKSSNE